MALRRAGRPTGRKYRFFEAFRRCRLLAGRRKMTLIAPLETHALRPKSAISITLKRGELSMVGSLALLALIIISIISLYGYFSLPDR